VKTVFIAGTDTDVGKTFITSSIAALLLKKGLHIGVIKWTGTGGDKSNPDIDYIVTQAAKASFGPGSKLSVSCPYNFTFPASPHLASAMEGKKIDPQRILEATKQMEQTCDVVIIEGVGGLMVPLNQDILLIDLIRISGCPVILIARSGLGTINHTLLSLEALRHRNIKVKAVVLNSISSEGQADTTSEEIVTDNKETIGKIARLPVFGPVPFDRNPLSEAVFGFVDPVAQIIVEDCA